MSLTKQSEDLAAAIFEFEEFRAKRKSKREPIPEKLWKLAGDLCQHYPKSRVASALNISRGQLNKLAFKPDTLRVNEKVLKVAPIRLEPVVEAQKPREKPESVVIAEVALPSGATVKLYSGIGHDTVRNFLDSLVGVH